MIERKEEEVKPKRERRNWENWCRTMNHPPECSCAYPDPSELIPMRGAAPGTRPMPRET